MAIMSEHVPSITEDAIFQILVRGEASTLHDAEEIYLNRAMPEILELLGGHHSNDRLGQHPLLNLVLAHGSRCWEDSIL